MNRIVLIGNGFDLAHGLKTRYQDFINWYWEQRIIALCTEHSTLSEDVLCAIRLEHDDRETWYTFMHSHGFFLKHTWKDYYATITSQDGPYKITYSPLFEAITRSMEVNKWVDIENEYYRLLKGYIKQAGEDDVARREGVAYLNEQLAFLQNKLIEYLGSQSITDPNHDIRSNIFAPIKESEVSVSGSKQFEEHINYWLHADEQSWNIKLGRYYEDSYAAVQNALYNSQKYNESPYNNLQEFIGGYGSREHRLPDQIMLLSFNYTDTVVKYAESKDGIIVNHIHGTLADPSSIIFGYGDELDDSYKEILNKNDNSLLTNVKSIRYLESDNYRKMLQFVDSAPFQIYIMGHSCGNSDRTLLNTLFEHKNCASIKPFYYTWTEKEQDGSEHVRDNYLELVQNISRNFTDMKLMRDRVVNKTYCKEITK